MNTAISKHFEYASREHEIYAQWEESGSFQPSGDGEAYFIPMPPPNITGQLHAGHALFATLQDILIRYYRMNGNDTLWLPGYDHAGLGAQTKILEAMAQNGIENPTQEQFDEFAAQWTNETRERITEQLKRLGASADWSKARYTLDEDYQASINEAFKRLYAKDLIYYNQKDGQWYLKLAQLAKPFIEALDRGELEIYPPEAEKRLRLTPDGEPLEQAHDWCISRQIMWGHQIPAWQPLSTKGRTDLWFIGTEDEARGEIERFLNGAMDFSEKTSNHLASTMDLNQSPDRLDTWFSSSLWIFAALGWPNQTPEFERYFPAATLETGWDIMFFWAAKMSMMSLALTGELPFKKLYLHGLIRDDAGEKMSKSKGNGIDPMMLSEQYGADALRWALASTETAGQDRQLQEDSLEGAKRLGNKIWNIGKWMRSRKNLTWDMDQLPEASFAQLEAMNQKIESTETAYHNAIAAHNFRLATQILREFIYDDLSGEIIETAKQYPGLNTSAHISDIYRRTLMMLHPFMPFISEDLWAIQGYSEDGLLISQQFKSSDW